jgi:hypothetical protein
LAFPLDKAAAWLYIICIIGKDAVKDHPYGVFFLFLDVLRLVKRRREGKDTEKRQDLRKEKNEQRRFAH